jgi:HK97 family phage major capsid protein
MSELRRLVETRANVWEQIKAHLDTAEKEGRADTVEADQTYMRMHSDMAELDARIAAAADLEKRNEAADEIRSKYAPKADEPKADADDAAILRRMVAGEIRAFDFAPREARDQVVGTTTAGGFTARTDFYERLVENLRVNAGVLRLNPTVMNTAGGNTIQIPKATTHASAAWLSEGGTVTESDAVFAQASLSAYKCGLAVQISPELEADTSVNLLEYLTRRGGEALGNIAGAAYVVGDGSSKPTGVTTQSTLGVTSGTGVVGAFTADNLIDLYFSVIEPYRMSAACGWLMNDATLAAVRKLKDGSNRYLFDVDAMVGRGGGLPGPDSPISGYLLGKPVVTDPNVAVTALNAKSVLFGDWSRYYVRNAGPVRVERSVDFAFGSDLVTYRFLMRTDGKLIDTSGAIKHFVGAAS